TSCAQECLELLGISHYFRKVYGAGIMGDCCKPDRKAFDMVVEDIGADPTRTGGILDTVHSQKE
ncbi:unnamed protein product, partial [Discosporangium mesarthrocarpum]